MITMYQNTLLPEASRLAVCFGAGIGTRACAGVVSDR